MATYKGNKGNLLQHWDSPYERAWNALVPHGETGYPN